MKRIVILTIIIVAALFSNARALEPGACLGPSARLDIELFSHLSELLSDSSKGDLSFCLGYIKKSKNNNQEIAEFISTWSSQDYSRSIPSMFRNKIDRVVGKLSRIDYQQLIIDIDLIKNSQLTVTDMVKLIKGTSLYRNKG